MSAVDDALIAPTHTCFDDALDWFEQVINPRTVTPFTLDTFRVVHGVCQAAGSVQYAHAWVEQSGCDACYRADVGEELVPPMLAWQAGMMGGLRVYFGIERSAYYETYRVQRATLYSLGAVVELNRSSGHYGPWEPEYVALCQQHSEGRVFGMVTGPAPSVYIVIGPNKTISIHGRRAM